MNYLAHLFFADSSPESRVGNLMGDFVRGAIDSRWPTVVQQGIWLHRKIDAFTDQHPDVLVSKSRLSPERRRLAGIILDIGFDHFLSHHWSEFNTQPKAQFIREVYQDFECYRGELPERMRRPVEFMVSQDWLTSYESIEGIDLTLNRVAQRFSRPTALPGSVEELSHNYKALEQDFLRFFPQLIEYVQQLKRSEPYLVPCSMHTELRPSQSRE